MRVAIIGSGIAGLTVAHHLHRRGHDITVFEANQYVGGHTATVDVQLHGRQYAIDTGFIVFNDWTYPNFIALLDELKVEWQYSNMSFSLRCERTGLEYNGTSVNSLFAQRRNALRPSFLRMIYDILRFNDAAKRWLAETHEPITLRDYLRQGGYSSTFISHYIVPMGRAIWSATGSAMLDFPARFFIDFFARHGFLNVSNRPVWRTVSGGSREYVRRLIAPFARQIQLGTPVRGVMRTDQQVFVRTAGGDVSAHDHVVFAGHSDQMLRIIDQPTADERAILGAFPYQANDVLLHTDQRMLPRRPLARAAWNYHLLNPDQERVALTYDMNVLQSLDASTRFLVTLNRNRDIDPATVLGSYQYHHPVYTPEAVAAQQRWSEINGHSRSFFCGAYWRYGFHEDGVVSGLNVVDAFERLTNAQHADDASKRRNPVILP